MQNYFLLFLCYQISIVWNKSIFHILSCTRGIAVKTLVEGDPQDKPINKCKLLLIFDQHHVTKGRIPTLQGPEILLMRGMWMRERKIKIASV